jgi:hypothetical protein
MAATARQEADTLKKELVWLKKLKEEEKENAEAQIQEKEKEDKLRNSVQALLGNLLQQLQISFLFNFIDFLFSSPLFIGVSDIPANTVGKPLADSAADAISFAVDNGELVRVLLQKNKAVLSRFHAMIFPKEDQDKTLEQLADVFSVDTEGTIEVFKRTSRSDNPQV